MSEVRLARASEIGELAGVLARGYASDPYFAYLAGTEAERNQRMRDGWWGILRHASDQLSATYTTERRDGVALWHPPGYGGPSFVDSLRLIGPMARLAGGIGRLREVLRVIGALEPRRRHHVPDPHWYLVGTAVETDNEGGDGALALLQPVLEHADRTGTSAYLETAAARNVLLFERARFDVVEELTFPHTDVHGWLMLRRPATAARSTT